MILTMKIINCFKKGFRGLEAIFDFLLPQSSEFAMLKYRTLGDC